MEEKNGDNEERRDSEQLTIRQNKSYNRRPLSNRTSDNHQVNHLFLLLHFYSQQLRSTETTDVV